MFHAKETVRISKQSPLWGEIAYVPSVPQCREVGNILFVYDFLLLSNMVSFSSQMFLSALCLFILVAG